MAERRTPGIEKRVTASGAVWRVPWRYGGTRDGERYSVTFDNPADAKTFKRRLEDRGRMVRSSDPDVRDRSIVTGKPALERRGGPTFLEVSERFLATRTRHRHRTTERYRQVVRDHLREWHDRPVESIDREEVGALLKRLSAAGVGPGPVRDIASAIFSFATQTTPPLRPTNPCKRVQLPETDARRPPVFLDEDEVDALVAAAYRMRQDSTYGLFVELTVGTGLRLSEVSGLRVRDLSLGVAPTLSVVQTIRPAEGTTHGVSRPKSQESRRTVPLDPRLAAKLRAQVKGRSGDAWVFPSRTGGPIPPTTAHERWIGTVRRAVEAGLQLERIPRFHDLRHTYARFLLMQGVTLDVVSEQLGHESIVITQRYYGRLGSKSQGMVRAALARRPESAATSTRRHLQRVRAL